MRKYGIVIMVMFVLAVSSCAWADKLFDCPIKNVPASISCLYGDAGYKGHTGYDLKADYGTPIYALFDGKVTYRVIYSDRKNDEKYHSWSYGNVLELTSDGVIEGNRYSMLVAHLSEFDGKRYTVPSTIDGIELICDHDDVADRGSYDGVPKKWICEEGMPVKKGQLIGYSGNCGNSTGDHLHIEIRVNGRLVDPDGYISRERFVGEYVESVKIDEDNFPDEKFRAALLNRYDPNHDGILTGEEIENINSLFIELEGISNLKGIEYFTVLKGLFCDQNLLTELDVSKNTALEQLNCDNNQLRVLDVGNNTALRILYCHNNQLVSLDVSGCSDLQYLYCNSNQLTALDLSGCNALKHIECNKNQLTTLDIDGCSKLQELDCSSNKLTTLDFGSQMYRDSCTNLLELNCSNNQLNDLDMGSCHALQTLTCSYNTLTTLNLSGCKHLYSITCDHNLLTVIDITSYPQAIVFCDEGVNVIRESKPKITTTSPDDAVLGMLYSFQLTATGSDTITWTYTGTIPEGLNFSASGLIIGIPTKAQTCTFVVKALNSYGEDTKELTLTVSSSSPISITTSSLKTGTIGKSYSVTLKGKGTKPLTWSAEGLPNGLKFSEKGKISGKPIEFGTFNVKFTLSNGAGSTTKELPLTIKGIPPKISGSLAKAELNVPYSSGLRLTKGSQPITWSVTGNLPEGLSFDASTGIISGTPESYKSSGFKLTITASNGAVEKSKSVKLKVKGTKPKITTSLPNATVGQPYTAALTATGSEPITWTATNLPEGLSLNGDTISGTPTGAAKSYKVKLVAKNPVKSVKKTVTLKVNAASAQSAPVTSQGDESCIHSASIRHFQS